jgi:predicted RecA/RadA family phage recombinase
MVAEATTSKDANANALDVIAPEALAVGTHKVLQSADGRAGVVASSLAVASGDKVTLITNGQFTVIKTDGVVILDGAKVYWDRSANSATPLKALAGADFYAGVAVGDWASDATSMVIDLNLLPAYTIDVMRDATETVNVGDATVAMGPGYATLNIAATSEAEKTDIMSQHSVPVTVPFIVEGRFAVIDTPSGAATDFNIGIANDTHATDGGAITEAVFIHFDNALDIFLESDDGTTEVAPTDSTVDATEGVYIDFAFDCRDLTDIQIYLDGVLMLPDTVFALGDATGPIKLLTMIEKTTGTEVGILRIAELTMRTPDIT